MQFKVILITIAIDLECLMLIVFWPLLLDELSRLTIFVVVSCFA